MHFAKIAHKVTKLKYFSISKMKPISKFWGEIYSENCQLFESFYRFQFTFMHLEKSIFLCESTCSALIFHHNLLPLSPFPDIWQSFITIEVCGDRIPAHASSCKKRLTDFFVHLLFFLKVKHQLNFGGGDKIE